MTGDNRYVVYALQQPLFFFVRRGEVFFAGEDAMFLKITLLNADLALTAGQASPADTLNFDAHLPGNIE